MSVTEENQLLKMVIETQASRIKEQEETIKELRLMVEELRSLKANLEETLEEFRHQVFGVKSEKTSHEPASKKETKTVPVKAHCEEQEKLHNKNYEKYERDKYTKRRYGRC